MTHEANGLFNEHDIGIDAPEAPGVYQIARHTTDKQNLIYIYIGQANNIKNRLREHLRGESDQAACINSRSPEFFFSQVIYLPGLRDAEEESLIETLNPLCNRT